MDNETCGRERRQVHVQTIYGAIEGYVETGERRWHFQTVHNDQWNYDLPNVPYVMYFYRGYGLHGTYWHNNFGTPMSHGCVNLTLADAKWLYEWAPQGARVVVQP